MIIAALAIITGPALLVSVYWLGWRRGFADARAIAKPALDRLAAGGKDGGQ